MPAPNEREDYFNQIGVPGPIRLRINTLLDLYTNIVGAGPDEILLENTVMPEGNMIYGNLACFKGDTYGDLPIAEPNWRPSFSSTKSVRAAQIVVAQDFDFVAAQPGSRLMVNIAIGQTGLGNSFTLQAAGLNCLPMMILIRQRYFSRIGL